MIKPLVVSLLTLALIPSSSFARDCKPVVGFQQVVATGEEYTIPLGDLTGVGEVRIDESLSERFGKSTSITFAPSLSSPPRFVHATITDKQVFYRVTLLNSLDPSFIPCTWLEDVLVQKNAALRSLVRRSYIPVVGSAPGAFGAQFRTSMILINPFDDETMRGSIVFRAQGVAGSSVDPQIRYELAPRQRIEYADIVPAFGRSGLGSLDIVPDDDSSNWMPLVQTRVFNLAADGATFGTAVPQVRSADVGEAALATFIIPKADTSRLNVGIRSWEPGATLYMTLYRSDGTSFSSVKDFPGDFFNQLSPSDLLGTTVSEGDTLIINSLGAIVYGAFTDNKSNDPTLRTKFGELETWKLYVGEYFH